MHKIVFLYLFLVLFVSCSPDKGKASKDNWTEEEAIALIESSDCLSCHKNNEEFIGPSYVDISQKYNEKDTQYLIEKIIEGGKGVWGDVPMTPHPKLSQEDTEIMVKYILSLK